MTKNITENNRTGLHPRPYISRAQLILWEDSPSEYLEKYLNGKEMGINRGMALGKEIADSLESGEDTGSIEKDLVIAQIPKYEIRDISIMASFKSGKEIIPILIKPDLIKSDYTEFIEVKTGSESTPWTQRKVDKDDQITFYAMGVYCLIRGLPQRIRLVWAPTRKVVGEDGIERPELTGEIKTFETKRTLVDIIKMQARCAKAWREIGKAIDKEII
jgi:hypothetical protein